MPRHSAIPDRWLNYKPVGKRIEGTRFIAFKVPLRKHIVQTVEEDNRLDVDNLLVNIPNLGIIIDLTNTNRYYDPEIFREAGVDHKKVMIPGHATPPDKLVNEFKVHVQKFLNENKDNDKLIGVHCTHGVNRTGYLICHFMITELSLKPDDAIEKFYVARGHEIERCNYLTALIKLNHARKVPRDDNIKMLATELRASDIDLAKRNSHEEKYEQRKKDIWRRPYDRDNFYRWTSHTHETRSSAPIILNHERRYSHERNNQHREENIVHRTYARDNLRRPDLMSRDSIIHAPFNINENNNERLNSHERYSERIGGNNLYGQNLQAHIASNSAPYTLYNNDNNDLRIVHERNDERRDEDILKRNYERGNIDRHNLKSNETRSSSMHNLDESDRHYDYRQKIHTPDANYSHRQHVPHMTPATENYGQYRRRQFELLVQPYRKSDRAKSRSIQRNDSNCSRSKVVPNYIEDYRRRKH